VLFVRATFLNRAPPEAALERALRKKLSEQSSVESARSESLGREAVCVQCLRQTTQDAGETGSARRRSQRRQATQVHAVL